jgi:hypothetical protein
MLVQRRVTRKVQMPLTHMATGRHHVIYASVKNIQYKIPRSPSLSSAVSLVFARILY